MSNELGGAIGNALTAGYGAFRSEQGRRDVLQDRDAKREHERNIEAVRQAIAQMQAASRERVANTGADSRNYGADLGYAGRTYAADTSADNAALADKGRRYVADMGYAGRTDAANTNADASQYRADQGTRAAGTRAAASRYAADVGARSRRGVAGINADASRQRGAMSLYGNLFKPRPELLPSPNTPKPPDLSGFLKSIPNMAPSGAVDDAMQPDTPPAAVGRPGKPSAAAAPPHAPEHQMAASQLLQQLREAQAKGDLKGVQALRAQATQFLSSLPPAGASVPDENDDGGDDGDDGDDDDPGQ